MKKIIITGSNGQLGRALNQLLAGSGEYDTVNTDVIETEGCRKLDITSIDSVMELAREVKPYAIINCAAHTNVNKCETDVENAYRINAVGPRNLSIAATETGAKMVQISTDYVFPGTGSIPLTEFDRPDPIGIYGLSKYAGENMVKDFAQKYFMIRTAWLYGDGNNFVKTMLKLSETNDTVKVVRDQFGTPTSALELAKAVLYLLPTENYGLFHGTCEGECAWSDFASEIFRLAGKSTRVLPITTEEYPTPAHRPAYSVLDNCMLRMTGSFRFADWHDAIEEYMRGTICL